MTSTFQSFWFGEGLSHYHHLALRSFLDHGHRYVLYAYKKLDVPAGIELRDASEVLPRSRVFFYGKRAGAGAGSVAPFSNLFRCYLLQRSGNWWVDTDVICLSDAVPTAEIFMGWESEDRICNAILKFPESHEFLRLLRDGAEAAGEDLVWGQTGPILLTRLVKESGLTHLISPQPMAYPVQSSNMLDLLLPARREEVVEKTSGRPFLHLWNEMFRRAVIMPSVAPPQDSFMAELFKRHGIDFGQAPVYSAEQMRRLHHNYQRAESWVDLIAEKVERARLEMKLNAAQARADALATELKQLRTQVNGGSAGNGSA